MIHPEKTLPGIVGQAPISFYMQATKARNAASQVLNPGATWVSSDPIRHFFTTMQALEVTEKLK
ncbi:MAG: hypothetical protein DYG98_01080 [Haliscomenobacteraceae bacterium CHB4]|nr:hypothetical protein [Haliscomenobacteraceae bacterium CHB4]